MARRVLCLLVSLLFLINLGIFNVSESSGAEPPPGPPVTFSYDNGTFYWVGDRTISGLNYYNDTIIDVRGNITINPNAHVYLHHTILRVNVTASNQNYKISVESNGYLYILDNSIITDSTFDEDIRTGQDPDFRYTIYSDGSLTIKNSLVEEAGPKYQNGIHCNDNEKKEISFTMENSTFKESSYGIALYYGMNILIKNSRIFNCSDRAIYLSGCTDSRLINVSIENVTGYYCVQFNYCYGNTYFLNGRTNNTKGPGVYVNYGDNYFIENNTFTNTQSSAINVYSKGRTIDVKNNMINHSTGYGIYIYKPIDSVVSHNYINDTNYGIQVYFGDRVIVARNTVLNTNRIGLYMKKCRDTFVRNNYVNYTSSDYIIRVDSDNIYRRITIENNTLTRAYMGIYLWGADYYAGFDSVIKNNIISGRSGVGEGIRISRHYYNRFENNIISNFDYGIFAYRSSYYSTDRTEIYGGEITDMDIDDVYLQGECYVHMYNVSFDTSKISMFYADYRFPSLYIYYNVDVYVEDTTGAVGGARVTVYASGNPDIVKKPTDKTGWARSLRTLYMYKYGSSTTKTYGPYNFTSDISGDVAYAPAEYSIDSYKTVQINHNIDTFPTPPVDLRLEVDYDTIILKWECYVNDLEMYKVFKNDTGGGWDLVGIGIPSGPQVTLTYNDLSQANKLVEYKYKVHHVDNAIQEELNDDWILFNDWVITEYRTIVSQSIQLNGSLIVEDGGYLNLRNTSILMNGTDYYPGIKAIEVRDGGLLVIKDLDDNNQTSSDRSFINASKEMGYYNFFVEEGGHLEIYNSWIQNSSYNTDWGDVNIYIESDNCTIMNSTVVTRANRAIHVESSENIRIHGNTIYKDSDDLDYYYGIYVYDSEGIEIANNTIDNSSSNGIEISYSSDITLSGNHIVMREGFQSGYKYGIYVYNSEYLQIAGNTFDGPNVGLYLYDNENLEINNNDLINVTDKGIEGRDNTDIIIESNTINILNKDPWEVYGLVFWESSDLEVKNNSISGFPIVDKGSIGMAFNGFDKLFVYNNYIKDAVVGIQFRNQIDHSIDDVLIAGNVIHDLKTPNNKAMEIWDSPEMLIVANFYYNVYTAISQESTEDIVYDDNVFWSNVTYGYFLRSGSTALIINASVNELPMFTLYLNTSSEVDLIDARFNLTSILISDKTCEARIHWTINVRIKDHYGNYIPSIFLRIRSILGTILNESTTDSNGYVNNIVILERVQLYAGNISYTPTSFEAEYANHNAYSEVSINNMKNISLQLGNNAPNVYNIVIDPQFPKTTDDLILDMGYTFLDAENDPENDTYYKWFKNGLFVPDLENETAVPANYTKKGESWYCLVIPGDSLAHGDPGNSLTVLIFNTKPIASALDLSPKSPDGLTDLYVNYTYYDIDDDAELGTQFHWYADAGSGYELRASTSLPTLSSSYTTEGEAWYVEVEPKDGEDLGDKYGSNMITIGNTVPRIENAYIIPDDPSTSTNISVEYTFIDVDGDSEGASKHEWYIDSGTGFGYLFSGISKRTLDAKYLTKGYRWMCKITPFDGEVYGTTVNSTSVVIGNTPPEISGLAIVPSNPQTTQNLSVTYDYYDRDSDLENGSLYEWFKLENSQLVKTGLKVDTLPSLFTGSGESWVCVIIPFDGVSYGQAVQSSPVVIDNKAPVVTDMAITPTIPYTTDDLTAYYYYSDDDNEPESGTGIAWYRNGDHQEQFDDQMAVPWTYTGRGDKWYFTVTPGDGSSWGLIYTCPAVDIENTPPEIVSLTITPKTAFTNDSLEIEFEVVDPDGDSIGSMEISWYLNGDLQGQYRNEESIPASATSKGQAWKSVLRVSDGDDYSEDLESRSVVIKNTAPEIVEFFPLETQLAIDELDTISFSIVVNDIDNDRLVHQWRVNDNSVDDDQSYTFRTDHQSAGNYSINVTVQDFGTGSVIILKQWQVTVNNVNRDPVLTPKAPLDPNPTVRKGKTLTFDVSFYDPDPEDSPTITWYLDGIVEATGESTLIMDPENMKLGKHTVEVAVNDGESELLYTWNVSVLESAELKDEFLGLKWDLWSIVLEGLVVGITGLIAFFGFLRLRKKKGALQRYMKEIEDDMKDWKDHPDEAEKILIAMTDKIETDFTHGKIEDFHYFLLDRQIKESLREIRHTKIKREFTSLPDNLRKELNVMLEDGRISDEEYQSFLGTLTKSEGISTMDKEGLQEVMRTWKNVDSAEGPKKKKRSKLEAIQLGWKDLSQGDGSGAAEPSEADIPDDETEPGEVTEEWYDDDLDEENDDAASEEEVWK